MNQSLGICGDNPDRAGVLPSSGQRRCCYLILRPLPPDECRQPRRPLSPGGRSNCTQRHGGTWLLQPVETGVAVKGKKD